MSKNDSDVDTATIVRIEVPHVLHAQGLAELLCQNPDALHVVLRECKRDNEALFREAVEFAVRPELPPELPPCPACGSTIGPFVCKAHVNPDGRRQVVCSTCGCRGPYESAVRTAEAGWRELPRPEVGADRTSGPYRRVTREEYDRLTAQGVPGEIVEGAGPVVYDERARDEWKRRVAER